MTLTSRATHCRVAPQEMWVSSAGPGGTWRECTRLSTPHEGLALVSHGHRGAVLAIGGTLRGGALADCIESYQPALERVAWGARARGGRARDRPASETWAHAAWRKLKPTEHALERRRCAPGVRSQCRVRDRGTEYVSESGIKWMTKRQRDRALCAPLAGRGPRVGLASRSLRPQLHRVDPESGSPLRLF